MKRIPSLITWAVLLLPALSAWLGSPALGGTRGAAALAEADRLWQDGKFEECLSLLDRLHKALPADARLSRWEVTFHALTQRAVTGKRHVYFMYLRSNSSRDAPGRQTALEAIDVNGRGSGWHHIVVCVEGTTGKVLWSRSVRGYPGLAVDPVTDSLYLRGRNIVELDAETGGVVATHRLADQGRPIAGLLLGRGVVVADPPSAVEGKLPRKVNLYIPRSKRSVEVDLRTLYLMSPDETRHLRWGRTPEASLECLSGNQQKLWTFRPGQRHSAIQAPFWLGDDVLWLVGRRPARAEVIRIKGQTGDVRWRTVLGHGAYAPARRPLGSGFYSEGSWNALRVLKDHLLVIDATGRLSFLDPDDGRIVSAARASRTHLCPPAELDDALVVCSFQSVRAIPLKVLLGKAFPDERTVLMRKARCLISLGKPADARTLMDELLRLDNRCADGWLQRAEACRALADDRDEAFSRCRYLALAGKSSDDRLRDRYGLVQLITLGSRPSWQVPPGSRTNLMPHGPRLYVGTRRGEIWEINTQSLEARRFTETDGPVAGLWTKTAVTASIPVGGRYQHVPVTLPDDPEKPDKADAAWWSQTGYDGKAVRYRGRHYRPLGGGRVRVLDDGRSVEYASPIEGIRSWEIHLSPEGPLGYGRGGVYALDEHLCPVRRLMTIALGGKPATSLNVKFLRSTADTLGVVAGGREGRFLQIYTRDGTRLLNEISLSGCGSRRDYPPQFVVLGDGYFFSSRSLSWAGASPGRTWRFGPPPERTQTDTLPQEPVRFFGNPVVHDGKLFVTAIDGCVYVFDVARILDARR